MKICIVMGGHFSKVKGGAQYQAMLLAKQLAADPSIALTYITRDVSRKKIDGYSLVPISGIPKLRKYGLIFEAPQLYKVLKEIDPDVVYQQALQGDTATCGLYSRRNDKRFVFHIASDFDVHTRSQLKKEGVVGGPGLIDKTLGQYGMKQSTSIIAQTSYQANKLKQNYGLESTATIRNFLPVPPQPPAKPRTPKIAWVANFKKVKRPELFVELAARMQGSGAEFVMAGRMGTGGDYDALAKKIKSTPNLSYLGELEVEGVESLLAKSHLLVNTSMVEGFPNTFIQAWFREAPVVTLGVNTDELLGQNSTFGTCTESMDEMEREIARLLSSLPDLKRQGQMARENAILEFSMDNAKKLTDILLAEPK